MPLFHPQNRLRSTQGLTVGELLAAVLVVVVLAGGGWWLLQRNADSGSPASWSQPSSQVAT